jgi:hypothetical protein
VLNDGERAIDLRLAGALSGLKSLSRRESLLTSQLRLELWLLAAAETRRYSRRKTKSASYRPAVATALEVPINADKRRALPTFSVPSVFFASNVVCRKVSYPKLCITFVCSRTYLTATAGLYLDHCLLSLSLVVLCSILLLYPLILCTRIQPNVHRYLFLKKINKK